MRRISALSLVGIFALSLVGGLGVSSVGFARGKKEPAPAPAPKAAAPAVTKELPKELKGTDPKPETDQAADFLKRQRYEDAIRLSRLALGRDERYVPALVVMATAYYYLKKYELSTAICDMVKNVDPKNAEVYNIGGFIALTRDDRIGATASFKKAVELKDDYGEAWDNLAAQYLVSKNYDGALDAAEHAAKLMPKSPKAHLNLGSAYRGKLRHQEADAEFKKVLDINKDSANANYNLGVLYLDAKEMPGMDYTQKMNTAINYFNRYKQLAGAALNKDDLTDQFIDEAKKAIDREAKKAERLRKQKDRDALKAAQKAEEEKNKPPATDDKKPDAEKKDAK